MIQRKLEATIVEMLDYFRIVAINGPRQSGKTTLQKKIAKMKKMQYYSFDDKDTFNAASNDPVGFLRYISKGTNVAIDEVQMIPDIVPAIKILVDNANKKGMFLLTGSSDMFKNSKIKESLAGRMASFNLFPLSYTEIHSKDTNIVDTLFNEDLSSFAVNEEQDKEKLIKAVINGGYPQVYDLPPKAKKAWFDFYIKSRITKDIASIENIQLEKVGHLDRLLKVLASQTASLVNYASISKAIGLADMTVKKYIQILEALYIVKLVPAYSSNQLKRVVKSPKVHFVDSGLASFLLNTSLESSMLGKNQWIGNLAETFVFSELVKHQACSKESIEIFHYRDQQRKELDFVMESISGDIVALEVKLGSGLKTEHFKGLLTLANKLKNEKFKGYLFYSGDKVLPYKIEDYQFWALPLSALV